MILSTEAPIDAAFTACEKAERQALRLFSPQRRKLAAELRRYIQANRWNAFARAVMQACERRHISAFEHAHLVSYAIEQGERTGKPVGCV